MPFSWGVWELTEGILNNYDTAWNRKKTDHAGEETAIWTFKSRLGGIQWNKVSEIHVFMILQWLISLSPLRVLWIWFLAFDISHRMQGFHTILITAANGPKNRNLGARIMFLSAKGIREEKRYLIMDGMNLIIIYFGSITQFAVLSVK